MRGEYLLILIGFLLITIFLDWEYKVKIYKSKKAMITLPVLLLVLGMIWDNFAVYRGHWSFPGEGLIGIKIGLIPIEEYLFVLIILYFILVTYNLINNKLKDRKIRRKS